ncbi:MAG: TerB family tellurite resistance protein, partial [Planctomycetes bacterium]|nr:TerB family tellurite resistance protein [Planctomycetota bacterium]
MVNAAVRRKFEALVSAAFIDGYLAESEKDILNKKASAMGIPPREVNDILFLGQQRKLSVSIPPTSLERDALLEDLIEVVTADGRVEAPEYHLLARFAETLKIPLPELRTRVNRRMQQGQSETRVEPRRETVRSAPPRPAPAAALPRRPEPPPPPAAP